MKKVSAGIVVVCMFVCVLSGCGRIENLIKTKLPMTDEYIIEQFNEAYDFWVSWIYGQDKDYDFVIEEEYYGAGAYLCAISEDAPIQTVEEFEAEMKKHFTDELCEEFLDATRPVEIDGRLCMYGYDVGGPDSGAEEITVEKIDDEKYRLNLDIWSYMDEEEPDLPDKCVYYVLEDGQWVFENDSEDMFFEYEKLPAYLDEEYAPYNKILEKYYAALYQKWDAEELEEHKMTDIVRYYRNEDRMNNMGFCLFDIDNNGQEELLVGEMQYGGKVIYDLYTLKDAKVHQVALGWERNRYYIYEEDGKYKILNAGSGGASLNSYDHYSLENGELKHEWSVIMDGFASPENPWFLADDDEFDVSDDTPIDQEKYFELVEGYLDKCMLPEYIPFEMLG